MSRMNAVLNEARGLPLAEQRKLALELLENAAQAEVPEAATRLIPRQNLGYWYVGSSAVPEREPSYGPTGAILGSQAPLGDDALCLDLVLLEGAWYPLSEAGQYAYEHTTALLQGEPVRFVLAGEDWGTIYEVEFAEPVAPDEVASVYGDEAGARCRQDYPAVQLRLTKVS